MTVPAKGGPAKALGWTPALANGYTRATTGRSPEFDKDPRTGAAVYVAVAKRFQILMLKLRRR